MKLFKLSLATALCAVLFSSPGQTIGRTGNGRMMGVEDGFTASMPTQLPEVQTGADGSLRCTNPAVMDSSGESPKVIVYRFSVANPSRAQMSRDDLKLELLNNDWKPRAFAKDPCVDLYVRDQGSVLALIGVWGVGKGFEVIGGRNPFTAKAIDEIVAGLVLEPGACAWK